MRKHVFKTTYEGDRKRFFVCKMIENNSGGYFCEGAEATNGTVLSLFRILAVGVALCYYNVVGII